MEQIILMCKYKKCQDSKEILNKALCYWANHLVKKKYEKKNLNGVSEKEFHMAQYEPNTFQTYDKYIWSYLRNKGIQWYCVCKFRKIPHS